VAWPAAALLVAHGLIHLMGVALEWRLAEVGDLRYADAVPVPGSPAGMVAGVVWLAAAGLFLGAGSLLLARRPRWWTWAVAGVVASAAVIALHPAPAVAGLVADGLVLLLVLVTRLVDRRTSR
jgi:hypothetical protein